MNKPMTSMERVLTALSFKEPDRVPFFLLLTMHGAKELGLSIKTYFSDPHHVANGQLLMQEKYGHDCFYAFYHAPIEIEAWGGEVIYREDGPPNSGEPFIKSKDQISGLAVPSVKDSPSLQKVFETIRLLKEKKGGEVPIIGVVMSPFSVPVMQMGFAAYIDLLYEEPALFERLMEKNCEFCIQWANTQLEAGVTAICYFDPLSSPEMFPRGLYLQTGYGIARKVLPQIKGPIAIHLASGRTLPVINDIIESGASVIGVSCHEDIATLKKCCDKRITMLGNMNGIEMRRWSRDETESKIKSLLSAAGPGGGFILSDTHGEIPWQVPDEVLLTIAETVKTYGRYPIRQNQDCHE